MSPGCSGFHPSADLVRALEAGMSIAANLAIQPKCAGASSRVLEMTGTPSLRPITSAIFLNGTPSSATA